MLLEEIKPFIEQAYGGQPHSATPVGHSLGGLLASHVMENSCAFDRFMLISPSLWWRDSAILCSAAEKTMKSNGNELSVFISVGSTEEEGPAGILKMVTNAQEMASILRERGCVDVRFEVFPDEATDPIVYNHFNSLHAPLISP